jgi:hypothetical protein
MIDFSFTRSVIPAVNRSTSNGARRFANSRFAVSSSDGAALSASFSTSDNMANSFGCVDFAEPRMATSHWDQLAKFISALNLGVTETHVQDDRGMGLYRAKTGLYATSRL